VRPHQREPSNLGASAMLPYLFSEQYTVSRHPTRQELRCFSLGTLSAAVRLQRHLAKCPQCLHRLLDIEETLPSAETDHCSKPNSRKCVFIVHDTGDGMIYCRAEKRGRKWFAHRWGRQISGGQTCTTLDEANEFLATSFREMFPEHRCTSRCRTNPPVEQSS
jgi:hypothetical protein